jgi:hypothetical protein
MIGRICNGIVGVGLYGAVALGVLFFIETIFSADSSLFLRLVFGVVALGAFLSGYFSEKEADKSGEDDAN